MGFNRSRGLLDIDYVEDGQNLGECPTSFDNEQLEDGDEGDESRIITARHIRDDS